MERGNVPVPDRPSPIHYIWISGYLDIYLYIFAYSQGDKLDSREQSCMASCQDRYLEARAQVQETLMKRQGGPM
jgi:hypothetical protein